MLTSLGRVLALACGVLLALPPGWCCKATAGECCGHPLPSTPATAPAGCCATKACSGHTCADDCCRKEPAQDRSAPVPKPQQPDRPCDTACCDRPPTDAPKVERPVIDLGPVGVQDAFTAPADPGAVVALVSAPPRSAFPPLHVLHCVWLCSQGTFLAALLNSAWFCRPRRAIRLVGRDAVRRPGCPRLRFTLTSLLRPVVWPAPAGIPTRPRVAPAP